MEYFRRPQIAGKNKPLTTYARVRGSVRRNDADGLHAAPYFAGVSAGQHLHVNSYNAGALAVLDVTLPSNDYATIISTLNTALATKAVVFDDDGAISIQSLTAGGNSYVSVIDGAWSCALAMGFDTRLGPVISYGGDLEGTPHGRIGNPNGVSVLNTGENITAASVQRGLGRLAANSDVMFADIMSQGAVMQPVASVTVAGDGTYITPPASTRIFTCGPIANNTNGLSRLSTKEDLAPYYFLFDTVTKQPTSSRIVGVTKGLPGGSRPYADCASWAGAGNVLGVSLVKQSGSTITSITAGKLIEIGTPAISDVVVGDLVEITGSTNVTPTYNGGTGPRWVIEDIDAGRTFLTVRPMSKSELAQTGSSSLPSQAQTELNDHKELAETYGSVSIHTGYATTNVNMYVDPPLPPNASVQLWAAQPLSIRAKKGWNEAAQNFPSALGPQSDLDTPRNALLSRPSLGISGGLAVVGGYYVRWRGAVHYVPAANVNVAEGANTGYLYWDEATCLTSSVITTSTTRFNEVQNPNPSTSAQAAVGTRGQVIAYYSKPATGLFAHTLVSINAITRLEGDAKDTYTVGWGGDFATLFEALSHLNQKSLVNSESATTNGSYPHADLVLLNDQTFFGGPVNAYTNLTIRGALPSIRLTFGENTSSAFTGGAGYKLTLKDLTLKVTATTPTVMAQYCGGLYMKNVVQDMSGGATAFIAIGVMENNSKVVIEDCDLRVAGGLLWGGTGNDISIRNSKITYGALTGITSSQIISSSTAGPSASAATVAKLTVRDSSFNAFPAVNAYALFVVDNGSGRFEFDNCYFSFDVSSPPVVGSILVQGSSNYISMNGCVVDGTSGTAVIGSVVDSTGTMDTHVTGCKFDVRPQDSGNYGVHATSVTDTSVTCFDSSGGHTNNVAVRVKKLASGNKVTGPVHHGIETSGDTGVEVVSNIVSLTVGTNTPTHLSCVHVQCSEAKVIGNSLTSPYVGVKSVRSDSTLSGLVVMANSVSITGASSGIDLNSAVRSTVSNNIITSTSGTGPTGINLTSPDTVSVLGNTVSLSSGGTTHQGTGIFGDGGAGCTVSGNTVFANTAFDIGALANISGNQFDCELADILGEFKGNVCRGAYTVYDNAKVIGNTFSVPNAPSTAGGVTLSPTAASCFLTFTDNVIDSNNGTYSLDHGTVHATSKTDISGNRISFTANLRHGAIFLFNDNYCGTVTLDGIAGGTVEMIGNYFGGNTTLTPTAVSALILTGNQVLGSLNIAVSLLTSLVIDGNRLHATTVTSPASGSGSGTITDNNINGNFALTSDATSAASFGISGNRVTGTAVVDGATGVAVFNDNIVIGASTLTNLEVTGCHLTNTTLVGGKRFDNCTVVGTLTYSGSGTMSWSNNDVSGAVTASSATQGTVCNNRFASTVSITPSTLLTFTSNVCAGTATLGKVNGALIVTGGDFQNLNVIGEIRISSSRTLDTTVTAGASPSTVLITDTYVLGTLTTNNCDIVCVKSVFTDSDLVLNGAKIWVESTTVSGVATIVGTNVAGSNINISDTTVAGLTVARNAKKIVAKGCSFNGAAKVASDPTTGAVSIYSTSVTGNLAVCSGYATANSLCVAEVQCSGNIIGTDASSGTPSNGGYITSSGSIRNCSFVDLVVQGDATPVNSPLLVDGCSLRDFNINSGPDTDYRLTNSKFRNVNVTTGSVSLYVSQSSGERIIFAQFAYAQNCHILGSTLIATSTTGGVVGQVIRLAQVRNMTIANCFLAIINDHGGGGVEDGVIKVGYTTTQRCENLTLANNTACMLLAQAGHTTDTVEFLYLGCIGTNTKLTGNTIMGDLRYLSGPSGFVYGVRITETSSRNTMLSGNLGFIITGGNAVLADGKISGVDWGVNSRFSSNWSGSSLPTVSRGGTIFNNYFYMAATGGEYIWHGTTGWFNEEWQG